MLDNSASLTVNDIADAVRVIDHYADAGALKGWHDIRQVLALRDRLEAFVTAASAQVNTPAPVLNEAGG